MSKDVATILLVFNRVNTTRRVFDLIRSQKPSSLFIIADGPRADRPEEYEKCMSTRKVTENVDWECQVLRNYSDTNLGCPLRVSSGLDWAFEHVEKAIILEDDCLPHDSFFRFCQDLLECYHDEERVMAISGQNAQLGISRTKRSYYFSMYPHCWGWATWRRAWEKFDYNMISWQSSRGKNILERMFSDERSREYWQNILDRVYRNEISSWAYRWMLSCWINDGLTVIPDVNLVSNIGFNEGATNTILNAGRQHPYSNLPTERVLFPLDHPPRITRNNRADRFAQDNLFNPRFSNRLERKIRRKLIDLNLSLVKFRIKDRQLNLAK